MNNDVIRNQKIGAISIACQLLDWKEPDYSTMNLEDLEAFLFKIAQALHNSVYQTEKDDVSID